MIAIPDFAAGAMENWGLITYRETAMLYDPVMSSESNKQRVTVVITHELGHQVPMIYLKFIKFMLFNSIMFITINGYKYIKCNLHWYKYKCNLHYS